MLSINKEYYVLEPDFFNTGILDFNLTEYKNDTSEMDSITYCHSVNLYTPVKLRFTEDQENPQLTDIMHARHPVLNNRLLDVIYPLELYHSQILSTCISDRGGLQHKEFFMWYVFNCIDCLDLKNSGIDPDTQNPRFLETMSLDARKLCALRKEKRMAFRLKESPDKLILHEELVTQLKKLKVSGAEFIRVESWGWDKII